MDQEHKRAYEKPPLSRVEALLADLNSGGSSGVQSYNDLEDKPSINGVLLTGDRAADDYSLVPDTRTINGKALLSDITITKKDIGLGNVDDTPDTEKPVSTAVQNALDEKADKTALDAVALPVSVSGDPVTFTAEAAHLLNPLIVHIEPVQAGSGDPSPENVRPISGWDRVTVTRMGKNLFPADRVRDSLDEESYGIHVVYDKDTCSYRYSGTATDGSVNVWLAGTYLNGKNVLPLPAGRYYVKGVHLYDLDTDFRFVNGRAGGFMTIPAGGIQVDGVRVVGAEEGKTYDETWYPMICRVPVGSTEIPPYEPPVGGTVSFPFPSEAGTVYGGTLDTARGILTVTHAAQTLQQFSMKNGSKTNNVFLAPANDAIAAPASNEAPAELISDKFRTDLSYTYLYAHDAVGLQSNSSGNIGVAFGADSAITDVSAANAWLSENPVQICYRLRQPRTYQLTPAQIMALAGANTVCADCGPVDVTVRPGTGAAVVTLADAGAAGWVPSWEQYMELKNAVIALGGNL